MSKSITVVPGTPVVQVLSAGSRITVAAIPGSGGTALVETSITPDAAVNPNNATWFAWPAGAVVSPAQNTFYGGAEALRFTATVASARFEVSA